MVCPHSFNLKKTMLQCAQEAYLGGWFHEQMAAKQVVAPLDADKHYDITIPAFRRFLFRYEMLLTFAIYSVPVHTTFAIPDKILFTHHSTLGSGAHTRSSLGLVVGFLFAVIRVHFVQTISPSGPLTDHRPSDFFPHLIDANTNAPCIPG